MPDLRTLSIIKSKVPVKRLKKGIRRITLPKLSKYPLRAKNAVKIAVRTLIEQKYISCGSTEALKRFVKKPTAMPGM